MKGYCQLKAATKVVRTSIIPLKLTLGHNCTDCVSWLLTNWQLSVDRSHAET